MRQGWRDWFIAKLGFKVGYGTGVKTVVDGSGNLYQANTLISATASELNEYSVTVDQADANTAGSVFVVVPHAGTIVGLNAVNHVANTTAATVLTAKIATVAVTAPAWTIGATQAAGVASSVVPTAANVVTAGAVVEIASDGGGTPVMPATYTLVVAR